MSTPPARDQAVQGPTQNMHPSYGLVHRGLGESWTVVACGLNTLMVTWTPVDLESKDRPTLCGECWQGR